MFYIVLLIAVLFIGSFVIAASSMAPWVPAWKKDLPRIFALAQLQPGETFYDLGCGNGKVVLCAGQQYQAKATGIELALPMYVVCKVRQLVYRNPNISFRFGNLFSTDISDADVVYVFGMPDKLANRLRDKLKNELTPGTRVVSYVFPIAELEPIHVDKPTEKDVSIYLYQM